MILNSAHTHKYTTVWVKMHKFKQTPNTEQIEYTACHKTGSPGLLYSRIKILDKIHVTVFTEVPG